RRSGRRDLREWRVVSTADRASRPGPSDPDAARNPGSANPRAGAGDPERAPRKRGRARRGDGAGGPRRRSGYRPPSEHVLAARRAALPTVTYPEDLPVSARRADIAAAIAENQVVIVAGETGSGKTTQLPKICLDLGYGIEGTIGHTQ